MAFVFAVLAFSSAMKKSLTCDELSHHIPAGYIHLTKGDFAFSPDAPPLSRHLGAAPLLLMDIDLPEDRSFWARDNRAEFGHDFFYGYNARLVNKIRVFSRVPFILVALLGGVFLFFWAREHFDEESAFAAAFFYFISPNILAHARLVTTDIAATVFILCSVLVFWDVLVSGRGRDVAASGIFLGLALMSKFSSLLLIPAFCSVSLLFIIKREKTFLGSFRELALIFSIALAVLWAGYGFEFRPFLEGVMRVEEKIAMAKSLGASDRAIDLLRNVPLPLSSYALGVVGVIKHGAEGARSFFMGHWSNEGNILYYVAAMAVKTPLSLIIAFFTGMAAFLIQRKKAAINIYLLFMFSVFFVFASRSDLQLGLRYILPVYPLLFMIAGEGLVYLFRGNSIKRLAAALLTVWFIASNLYIWPDYLSYFNEIAGGPDGGYRYLRDSNIDWGQDLPALRGYYRKNNLKNIYLSYFGSADPGFYGIIYTDIPEEMRDEPSEGVYAISVNNIDSFPWAKKTAPTARAGRSIYIYDLRKNR